MPYKTQRARTAYQREYRARRRKAAPVLAFPGSVPDAAGAVSEWARRCLLVPPGHPKAGAALRDSGLSGIILPLTRLADD